MKLICGKEFNFPKECVITELNPIEDFEKHLKDGFDPAIGIYKFFFAIEVYFICYIA